MSECKCDFRAYMVGDGCEVCNPAKSLEYAKETIAEQEAEITRLQSALRYEQHLSERIGTHGPGCETWGPAHYECLRRELKRVRVWQPMATAPDGVMLLFADMRATEARNWAFCGWRHSRLSGDSVQMPGFTARSATHWMPLPKPPVSEAPHE